jgi:uroporphyrinogen decarboxylase
VAAGCDAIQVFDSWASVLSTEDWAEQCAPHTDMLLQTARDANAVAIHYVNGAAQHLDRMAQSPGHVLGFDWRLPIGEVRRRVPARYALQGNLDPTALYCDEATLRRKVAAVCRDGGDQHIFNLGHGILPSTDPEAVAIVVDEVRKS